MSFNLTDNMMSNSSTGADDGMTIQQILGYRPNEAAAVICAIPFFVLAACIMMLTCRTRSWFMCIAWITAGAEGFGLILRSMSADSNGHIQFGQYVGATLIVLVAPNGLALVDYKILGKMIAIYNQLVEPAEDSRQHTYWRIPLLTDSFGTILATRVARLFFFSDLVSFVLQLAGGIMLGSADPHESHQGRNTALSGIVIQFVFFGIFIVLSFRVYQRHRSIVSSGSFTALLDDGLMYDVRLLKWAFFVLATTMTALLVRNVYRLFEFTSSDVASNEALFYFFDIVPMIFSFVILTVRHCGLFMPRGRIVGLAGQDSTVGMKRVFDASCIQLEDHEVVDVHSQLVGIKITS